MKTKTVHLLTLGATLLLAPLTSTLAQSAWQTVDALTPWRGRAIVADNAGNFISLAIDNSTSSTGPVSTAVSVSGDTGLTWQTVGSIPGYALKLSASPDGTLFASGNRSAMVSGRAFVWESTDHGATWTTTSDPWAGQTTALISMDVAAGNAGAVYLCGWLSGGNRWLVRKGLPTPSGISWSTVDNYPASGGSQPNSVFVQPSTASQPDDILVAGPANGLWTVRHSADGGATWTTIDSYNASTPNPLSVIAGPDGSIYTSGRITTTTTITNQTIVHNKLVVSYTTTTQTGWLVRKSSNGGASWSNVDYVANGFPAYASSLAADAFGRVFAVGYLSTTPNTWLVRMSTDSGATWATSDSFLPTGFTSAQAFGVAEDALGNVCVVGDVENGTATADLAPIRRLPAP